MTSLRILLRLNAAICIGFGATFLLAPGSVAMFLGTAPHEVIFAVGLGLWLNGLHLAFASFRAHLKMVEVMWFSLGDLLWWLASLALIAAQVWITSASGTAATWAVAIAVAAMGLAQLWQLGLLRSGLSSGAHLRRIVQSWHSMKIWVKVWLFALNGVFLAALFLVPSPLARIVLVAYVASGPILIAFAFLEGGLSRITGIGHLIPWIPLLVWLPIHLASTDLGPMSMIYVALLFAMCAICLALDVHDVWRWYRGERQILAA